MSGRILIALAANEIVMCNHSILRPLDPIIDQYPAVSIKVLKDKPIKAIGDKTIILTDQAVKAIKQMQESIYEMLNKRVELSKIEQISNFLIGVKFTHDHAIKLKKAKSLGLSIPSKINVML
jgi:ClpP class serine protease